MGSIVYVKLNDTEIPNVIDIDFSDKLQGDQAMTASGIMRVDRPTQQILTDLSISTLPMTKSEAIVLKNIIRNNLTGAITVISDFDTEEKVYYLQDVSYKWQPKNSFNQNNIYNKDSYSLQIKLTERGGV